jgi:hypothetical protein
MRTTYQRFILVAFCFLCLPILKAQSISKRIALVIGVKNYEFATALRNTLNDAHDMATSLKQKGFQVIELYDPQTKRQLQNAIIEYFKLLQENKNAAGLLYYSGHGMQIDGSNYLIPTKANPEIKADVEEECLNMDYVMRAIEQAGNPLNIFILDACRNNPFKSFVRSAEKGLSMVSTPKGSYIVYATKPGDVASDGSGRNGLFTSKLLKYIDAKGLNIEQVFKKTANDVSLESNTGQRPWIASDYTGDFFFTPGAASNTNTSFEMQTVVAEDFSNNSEQWLETETKDILFRVQNGKYRLQSKKGGSWLCTKPYIFNRNRDFEVSAQFTKIDGTDGFYFGILLGRNDNTGYCHFAGITGQGDYVLANKGPLGKDLIQSRPNQVVQQGNTTNIILVKKMGNLLKLFVNGQEMGEVPAEEFFGDSFGFQIWSGNDRLTVDVDNFTIKYY